METLNKIKDLVEKMSVDTQKVYDKGNRSASIRARKYAQEIKLLIETAGGKIVEKRSSMKDYLIILVDNEKEKD